MQSKKCVTNKNREKKRKEKKREEKREEKRRKKVYIYKFVEMKKLIVSY